MAVPDHECFQLVQTALESNLTQTMNAWCPVSRWGGPTPLQQSPVLDLVRDQDWGGVLIALPWGSLTVSERSCTGQESSITILLPSDGASVRLPTHKFCKIEHPFLVATK